MSLRRIIPTLLLDGEGLAKGVRFANRRYVGDPINAVQIFNLLEVDEIVFLDVRATAERRIPSPDLIQRIADHCLVPFAVGGGIRTVEDARALLKAGAEKVVLNTAALERPQLVSEIAEQFGTQSVVVSIDVKKQGAAYSVYTRNGSERVDGTPEWVAERMQERGAGEVLVNAVDRDGTRQGYDLDLLRRVRAAVRIPVIALGGAGTYADLKAGLSAADAVAAGSLFVFFGRREAVLINYPNADERTFIAGLPNAVFPAKAPA